MKMAVVEGLSRSYSYTKYRNLVSGLFSEGKATGPNQTDDLLHYTELNEARMNRLDKKAIIAGENINRILALKQEYTWLLLSEGWCGDAAQILPVLNKLAVLSPNIEMRIALRDENDALMNAFLTNGSRSIPKLIVLDRATSEVRGHWGPRPKAAADLIASYKRQYGVVDGTARTELHLWYAHDKGVSTQDEVLTLMEDIELALYTKR